MNWMGPEQALGFAAPLGYFLFIILSTLRLDFWLSTFTGCCRRTVAGDGHALSPRRLRCGAAAATRI
jgi:hypothetical protein